MGWSVLSVTMDPTRRKSRNEWFGDDSEKKREARHYLQERKLKPAKDKM